MFFPRGMYYLWILMYIFRNAKDIVTGLYLFEFFRFVRSHLLSKVAVFAIFHFDLTLIIRDLYFLVAGLTLLIGVHWFSLTALALLNALQLFLMDNTSPHSCCNWWTGVFFYDNKTIIRGRLMRMVIFLFFHEWLTNYIVIFILFLECIEISVLNNLARWYLPVFPLLEMRQLSRPLHLYLLAINYILKTILL
jgi:hypothetical protein